MSPYIEEMLMTRPHFFSTIGGTNTCDSTKGASRFSIMIDRHSSVVTVSHCLRSPRAALLTRMSTSFTSSNSLRQRFGHLAAKAGSTPGDEGMLARQIESVSRHPAHDCFAHLAPSLLPETLRIPSWNVPKSRSIGMSNESPKFTLMNL